VTGPQLRRFWAMLRDISRQVEWVVNGQLCHMDEESWRLVMCAAYTQETRIAQGINGGHVVLGLRLRDIFKGHDDETRVRIASELIELVYEFGARNSVKWTDPKEAAMREQYEQEMA